MSAGRAMSGERVCWRDSAMTWPTLTAEVYLPPWHWRLIPRGWYDYSPAYGKGTEHTAGWWGITGQWLMVKVDFGFNLPPFAFERTVR